LDIRFDDFQNIGPALRSFGFGERGTDRYLSADNYFCLSGNIKIASRDLLNLEIGEEIGRYTVRS
jgi:hypothetical protein